MSHGTFFFFFFFLFVESSWKLNDSSTNLMRVHTNSPTSVGHSVSLELITFNPCQISDLRLMWVTSNYFYDIDVSEKLFYVGSHVRRLFIFM